VLISWYSDSVSVRDELSRQMVRRWHFVSSLRTGCVVYWSYRARRQKRFWCHDHDSVNLCPFEISCLLTPAMFVDDFVFSRVHDAAHHVEKSVGAIIDERAAIIKRY